MDIDNHSLNTIINPITHEKVNDIIENNYSIRHWGANYYYIDQQGNVIIRPDPENIELQINLAQLMEQMQNEGLRFPALLCLPQILEHRLKSINAAFNRAMEAFDYKGDYFLVYPIKVNQQKRVIETLINHPEPMGLEAGSKAELLTVLGHATPSQNVKNRSVIICNGYKDREYIRLALIGEKLGHHVYLVIEKLSELAIVLEEAKELNVQPRLGLRARLASQAAGKWQSSGGEKSKFGLDANQILQLIDNLKKANMLTSLQLLHFHLGSQISNIRDIATGVRESAQFYVQLHNLGVDIKCFDVGGGLGVDYEGTRSSYSDGSVNYGLNEYANNVVRGIYDACEENNLPHPTIITESGRALTAHHAILVSNIIGIETAHASTTSAKLAEPHPDAPRALHNLWETWLEICDKDIERSFSEWFHDSQLILTDVHAQFALGILTLEERAWSEELFMTICQKIAPQLDAKKRAQRQLIDELQERMADKLYVNFSLFQSLPDSWGIDQIFPVLPLTTETQRANVKEQSSRQAIILDITCDSDGALEQYIDDDGVTTTMSMPPYDLDNPPLLGFFMVGAYQEILGNMHNLFGDTTTVDVMLDEKGQVHTNIIEGDSVANMLRYVQLQPISLLAHYKAQIENAPLTLEEKRIFLEDLSSGLEGYTYLEGE